MTVIKKKRVLARFPKHYPLSEACKIIREWDPKLIKCGYVEGIPYVYAESKETQFSQRVAKLLKQGIIFEETAYIPKFDNDTVEPEMPEPNEQPRAGDVNISDDIMRQLNDKIQELDDKYKDELSKHKDELSKHKEEISKLHKDIAELRADNNKKGKEIARLNKDVEELNDYFLKEEADATQQTSIESVIRNISPPPKRPVSPKPQRKSPSPKKKSPAPKRDKSPVHTPSRTPVNGSSSKSVEKPVEKAKKPVEEETKEYYEAPFDKYEKVKGIGKQKDRQRLYISFGSSDKVWLGLDAYKTVENTFEAALALLNAKISGDIKTKEDAADFTKTWREANL